MMNDSYDKAYVDFHQRLLNAFIEQVKLQPPFILENCNSTDTEFLHELTQLPHSGGNDQLIQGQTLMCKIVATYPHIMPILPRDLLWFFGGDCLHYMPDEEIRVFQQLDEQREEAKASGQAFTYEKARMGTMGLH